MEMFIESIVISKIDFQFLPIWISFLVFVIQSEKSPLGNVIFCISSLVDKGGHWSVQWSHTGQKGWSSITDLSFLSAGVLLHVYQCKDLGWSCIYRCTYQALPIISPIKSFSRLSDKTNLQHRT